MAEGGAGAEAPAVAADWRGLQGALAGAGYVAGDPLAMALHLSLRLGRPLLLEGAAGVGKTALARTLADLLGARLIRLQCYEGLDAAAAIYEWNYQRQILALRAREGDPQAEERVFSERYLLRRPLLEAISQDRAPVLLIDEVDRADEEFEALLLEVLSDFQISIPELGTVTARARPHVILTANGARDLSDALRRRCLYAHIPYPDRATELAILRARGPALSDRLAAQIVAFVQRLRAEDLDKAPGVAETLDWAAALAGLGVTDLTADPATVHASLVCLLKTEGDRAAVPPEVVARLAGRAA
jgi:MoxR-like ATPase